MSAKTLRNLLTALVILVVGVVVAMALVKMGKKPERQAPPASRPVVSAFTVAPETEPIRVKSFGSVKAKRSISIVPRVGGEVVEKSPHFEAGGYFTETTTGDTRVANQLGRSVARKVINIDTAPTRRKSVIFG